MDLTCKQCASKFRAAIELPLARAVRVACPACGFQMVLKPASGEHARVILIGALFRANRFRANPTNLYGADEYIEEQIPEKEFKQIVRKLFPQLGPTLEAPIEPREYDEARRLARLILSDIIIY